MAVATAAPLLHPAQQLQPLQRWPQEVRNPLPPRPVAGVAQLYWKQHYMRVLLLPELLTMLLLLLLLLLLLVAVVVAVAASARALQRAQLLQTLPQRLLLLCT